MQPNQAQAIEVTAPATPIQATVIDLKLQHVLAGADRRFLLRRVHSPTTKQFDVVPANGGAPVFCIAREKKNCGIGDAMHLMESHSGAKLLTMAARHRWRPSKGFDVVDAQQDVLLLRSVWRCARKTAASSLLLQAQVPPTSPLASAITDLQVQYDAATGMGAVLVGDAHAADPTRCIATLQRSVEHAPAAAAAADGGGGHDDDESVMVMTVAPDVDVALVAALWAKALDTAASGLWLARVWPF